MKRCFKRGELKPLTGVVNLEMPRKVLATGKVTFNADMTEARIEPSPDDKPTPAIERLHGLIEQLAGRFEGFLPWADEYRGSTVRSHEMFIKDTIRKADAIARAARSTAPSASGVVERDIWNSAIDAAARTAMDMPLTSGEERHDYRWSDTYKSAALEISNAIRALADSRGTDG